jgi:glycosyltransferase involved in cell wall biosynthesis
MSHRPLRVCIDARLDDGLVGGVQQEIMGLASGLSRLPGDEEYLFLAHENAGKWLGPHLSGPCRLLPAPGGGPGRRRPPWRRALRDLDKRRRRLFRTLRGLPPVPDARIPRSDGTVEAAGAEVMHFATQGGFLTDLPSIYAPQDLQHLHLPELFSVEDHAFRRGFYRPLCERARAVVALARWGKQDLVASFGLPPEKVHVIGLASILAEYPDPTSAEEAAARARLALPAAFAFYPAQTFRHKNHLGLVRAVAVLRERGLEVPVVLSGHQNAFFPEIAAEIARLRVGDLVRSVGYVSPGELKALYRLARLLAFPSRFEGFGMPVVEAFHAGLPVACSGATCLPDVAGDAALLFDPDDPGQIAEAIARLWTDERLRADLAARGRARAAAFTWDRMARSYRALYRQVGSRPLTEEDRALLAASL